MPAIAAIAIQDGQATPVTHTYNPVQTVEPATYIRNGDTSVPAVGLESVLLSLKNGSNDSESVKRARVTLRIPVLETPSGGTPSGYVAPPKVAYYLQADVTLLLPNRSTAVQRKDLRVLLADLLGDPQVVSLVEQLEKPY